MRPRRNVADMPEIQKLPPFNTPTEDTVLATIMRYNEKYEQNRDILNVDLFYYDRERTLYQCIAGVIDGGGITDKNSLLDYSQRYDFGYTLTDNDIMEVLPMVSPTTFSQDVERLRDYSRRRHLWRVLELTAANMYDLTAPLDVQVSGLVESVGAVQSQLGDDVVTTFEDGANNVKETVDDNSKGKRQALMTGFKLFDENYLLRRETLTIIAAFPAVGKSALALNIAEAVAKEGNPVAYYSMEMGAAELVSRSLSYTANLPAYVIMNKPLSENQFRNLYAAMEKMKDLPIYFDDRATVSFERVMRSIRRLVKTKGIKLAIIDYLQIFNQSATDEEEGMSYMARACKNIAKETGIPVIALSQLNRSAPHPNIRMLRGSGQIEESADNVVLIDRPEAYPDNKVTKYEGEYKDVDIKGTAKLILSKGRGVGIGCSLVAFRGMFTRFLEIEKPDGEKAYEHDTELPF